MLYTRKMTFSQGKILPSDLDKFHLCLRITLLINTLFTQQRLAN